MLWQFHRQFIRCHCSLLLVPKEAMHQCTKDHWYTAYFVLNSSNSRYFYVAVPLSEDPLPCTMKQPIYTRSYKSNYFIRNNLLYCDQNKDLNLRLNFIRYYKFKQAFSATKFFWEARAGNRPFLANFVPDYLQIF